jgi:ribosome-associated protein
LQRKKPSGTKPGNKRNAPAKAPSRATAGGKPGSRPKRSPPRNDTRRKQALVPGGSGEIAERVNDVARTRRLQESRSVAEAAIDAALEKQALLPVLIDVSARGTYTDFIGIVSGKNDRQVDAIAENVARALTERGWHLLSREGTGNGRWTLLDFGDIVIHVFYHPVREFYDIESLWIDAPRVKLTVPPEAAQLREETLFYERP